MSTAKLAEEVPQSTAKDDATAYRLTAADFAEILIRTLELAGEVGLVVGVRHTAASVSRPAGLLIHVSGLTADEQGNIIIIEATEG